MNLELLDPFRKQIPDRVDATLSLPSTLHFSKGAEIAESSETEDDWKAANHVAFNRRGTYVAIGYGSGAVAVFDVLSRTLTGLYRDHSFDGERYSQPVEVYKTPDKPQQSYGVTSVSWSRRSRTILAGATGNTEIRLIDTTHPVGPEECVVGLKAETSRKDADEERSQSPPLGDAAEKKAHLSNTYAQTKPSTKDHYKKPRLLDSLDMQSNRFLIPIARRRESVTHLPVSKCNKKRYPALHFHLPHPMTGSLQIHPKDCYSGMAVLDDGSLVGFCFPHLGWEEPGLKKTPHVRLVCIYKGEEHFVTSASFDPKGQCIYAATKNGKLLGFDVGSMFHRLGKDQTNREVSEVQIGFVLNVSTTVWHVTISRNGRFMILNCADATLRLYEITNNWWMQDEKDIKAEECLRPTRTFQDVVSKIKFASCDISGDGEYIVGGTNGTENKYELYIWNRSTGTLMDKLTGSTVDLYSVSWHPTRNFLAVAASDGIVDIWGPRINWTAFAPDFQALPQNVEYVECEDEFDVCEGGENSEMGAAEEKDDEGDVVDILAVEHVPVFASDSEDEAEVFHFDTKVKRILGAAT